MKDPRQAMADQQAQLNAPDPSSPDTAPKVDTTKAVNDLISAELSQGTSSQKLSQSDVSTGAGAQSLNDQNLTGTPTSGQPHPTLAVVGERPDATITNVPDENKTDTEPLDAGGAGEGGPGTHMYAEQPERQPQMSRPEDDILAKDTPRLNAREV